MIGLLRMARWARRPPSWGRVVLILAVIAVCLTIALIQWAGWWPDAATLPVHRRGILRG